MNFKKYLLILSLLLILCVSLGTVSATDVSVSDINEESTLGVDNVNLGYSDVAISEGNDKSSLNETHTFEDIQNMIDNAKPGDTIELKGNYRSNGSPNIGINVYKSLTIKGIDAVLDANGKSRIFFVFTENVTFENLIMINGCTFNNEFDNNDLTNGGGAVLAVGYSNINFINCKFINCNSSYGGAILIGGSGNIFNCTFEKCSANVGSAIHILSNGFNVESDDSGVVSLNITKLKIHIASDIKGAPGTEGNFWVSLYSDFGCAVVLGDITLLFNGEEYNFSHIGEGICKVPLPNEEGEYEYTVIYKGDNLFESVTEKFSCYICKESPEINFYDENKNMIYGMSGLYGEDKTIFIKLNDPYGFYNNERYVNKGFMNINLNNEVYSVNITQEFNPVTLHLPVDGIYNLEAIYLASDDYAESSNCLEVVTFSESQNLIWGNDVINFNYISFYVSSKGIFTDNLTIIFNNTEYVAYYTYHELVEDIDGSFVYYNYFYVEEEIPYPENEGDYTGRIFYKGSNLFNPLNITCTLHYQKQDSMIEVMDNVYTLPNSTVKIPFRVLDLDESIIQSGNVSVEFNDKIYIVEDDDDSWVLILESPKDIGVYEVTLNYSGTDRYNSCSKTFNLNVIADKLDINDITGEVYWEYGIEISEAKIYYPDCDYYIIIRPQSDISQVYDGKISILIGDKEYSGDISPYGSLSFYVLVNDFESGDYEIKYYNSSLFNDYNSFIHLEYVPFDWEEEFEEEFEEECNNIIVNKMSNPIKFSKLSTNTKEINNNPSSEFLISSCTFNNCGNAIYSSYGKIIVVGSEFINNNPGDSAILTVAGDSSLYLSNNNTFLNNNGKDVSSKIVIHSNLIIDNISSKIDEKVILSASLVDDEGNNIGFLDDVHLVILDKDISLTYNKTTGKYEAEYIVVDYSDIDGYCLSCTNLTIIKGNITSSNKVSAVLTLIKSGSYYKATTLTAKLVNSATGKGMANEKITLKIGTKTVTVTTNADGIATYLIPYTPATYAVTASVSNEIIESNVANLTVKISKATATISASSLTTTYNSGKYFQVKVLSKDKKPVVGLKLKLKVYTGSKYKTVTLTTDSNGIAKYSGSTLSIAKHKVVVSSAESTKYVTASTKTAYITVKKGTTTVVAPKVTNKCGVTQYFTITVSNTAKKVPISGLALTVKIYNGKKLVKSYSLKTNSNGKVSINTKSFKQGTYKIVISSSNKYYTVSKTVSSGIVMQKQKTIVSADKVSYLCGSSKYLKINVTKAENGAAISGLALTVKVYNGKKLVKTYSVKTASNGIASVNTKALGKGTYKVVISSSSQYYSVSKSVSNLIEIYKYKTTVNAPKVTNKYKSSNYFKINVTDVDGLPISKLSLSVKVYTGKKYKTYTVTTNAEGIASLNTKALSKGTHKVVISSKNVAYDVSKSGNLIVIK